MARITVIIFVLIVLSGACTPSPRYSVDRTTEKRPPKTAEEKTTQADKAAQKNSKTPPDGTVIRGMASYYADDFHNRKTANGEIYNMHGLTAAHKTWDFNTWLEVKNLSNGRTVVVRVNDRGPYVGNRIIDLSLGAAKVLGMIEAGVQEVEIEILRR